MTCPAIITGDQFLVRTLAHIDCQARGLGTFGYQALGEPGSMASLAMSGLLTLFVALYGLRLLLGSGPGMRDTVFDVLRIGIVLTLAFSWPAWKTVIYDVVIDAPGQIAAAIATSDLAPGSQTLAARLQAADSAMVDLAATGTGRQNGALVEGGSLGGNFSGVALRDEEAFGNARLFFLAGVIGSVALLRIAAGLLLALTPLAAGLLLFNMTRGLFSGWLRGLVLTVLGTIGASVVLTLELAVIEPWLADALRVRTLGYATPAAPTELFAMTLAFAVVLVGMVWLLGRVAFTRGWQDVKDAIPQQAVERFRGEPALLARGGGQESRVNRVERIADSVSTQIRREEFSELRRLQHGSASSAATVVSSSQAGSDSRSAPRLGSSYRRTAGRSSTSGSRRDSKA